jgi:hypothetical protein
MSVAGYEKVKTKVIEGKKKCIYKKHKGTKLYVKGFGKMRSVESYIKLCKKSAAAKAAKASKPVKSKKTRSKTTRKYGGFLQEFFSNMENMETGKEKKSDKSSAVVNQHSTTATTATAPPTMSPATPPPAGEGFSDMSVKTGGSNCNRGGKNRNRQGGNNSNSRQGGNGMINDFSKMLSMGGYRGGQAYDQFQNQVNDQFQNQVQDQFQNQAHDQFQNQTQDGGRRRKRNKVPKSMLDKLMMAANFGKRSAKKGKKLRRKGGNVLVDNAANALGQSIDSLGGLIGGKNGGSSQFNY